MQSAENDPDEEQVNWCIISYLRKFNIIIQIIIVCRHHLAKLARFTISSTFPLLHHLYAIYPKSITASFVYSQLSIQCSL